LPVGRGGCRLVIVLLPVEPRRNRRSQNHDEGTAAEKPDRSRPFSE
jgi:hypothetical protein